MDLTKRINRIWKYMDVYEYMDAWQNTSKTEMCFQYRFPCFVSIESATRFSFYYYYYCIDRVFMRTLDRKLRWSRAFSKHILDIIGLSAFGLYTHCYVEYVRRSVGEQLKTGMGYGTTDGTWSLLALYRSGYSQLLNFQFVHQNDHESWWKRHGIVTAVELN